MDELSKRYDAIIIDSPPCIGVSDAYVLSTHADSVVYVTKYDQVAVPTIRTCMNRFTSINTSIIGVVVNQIDFEAAHYYGKYQDYYTYQEISDETLEPEPTKA